MIPVDASKVINSYNVCLILKLSSGIRRYFFAESNGGIFTTVKVAADWAPDSASDWALDWASHSTVFNHSKVDYLNPFFWLLLRYFSL